MNYFTNTPHLNNFVFADHFSPKACRVGDVQFPLTLTANDNGVFRIQSPLRAAHHQVSQAELSFDANAPTAHQSAGYTLDLQSDGTIRLFDGNGETVLQSLSKRAFGVCGQAHLFCFRHEESFRYYGMGEKLLGLELTGVRTRFWNTDAFADFAGEVVHTARVDPYYVSIPYCILRTPRGWVGLLLNNPFPTFMSIASAISIESFKKIESEEEYTVIAGAEDGELDLFVLVAPDLGSLTRKFQTLVGTTPLPPLWAMGYHQCRWGYRSAADLRDLKAHFEEHEIPVDALWLDIDYMRGYRVFTLDADAFAEPEQELKTIRENGQKVVPIIDPGVKKDPGYPVYEDGVAKNMFCTTPEGNPYVGLVWPGETVFPDFSREDVRAWWAQLVEDFARLGFEGAWLDMNDPSTGFVNLQDMRFDKGRLPHAAFHNQYGSAMARASREGFLQAWPDARPFLLTRSSFTAGARYAAVWTGDNVSNTVYLKKAIPTSLNLALSGIPFNGGDVGGFAENTTPALLRAWMRAGFLTPFFRNHSAANTAHQEPWGFDDLTLNVCRECIRSRYRVLPYLYQLFVEQEACGEAIMRPLFYDFPNGRQVELDRIEDAYLLGPALLHAPVLADDGLQRDVPLPAGTSWYALQEQKWWDGDQWLRGVKTQETTTPLYVRDGSLLPLRPGVPTDHHTPLNEIELAIFMRADGVAKSTYTADDGRTFAYQRGERTRLQMTVEKTGVRYRIKTDALQNGYGPVRIRWVLIGADEHTALEINGAPLEALKPYQGRLAGSTLNGMNSEWQPYGGQD